VTLRALVESRRTERFITALILVNAVTLGLETSETVMGHIGPLLLAFDRFVVAVFVIEILLRLAVHRLAFFLQPWSIFDFVIVAVSVMPATQGFQVLRALRVLRVLRMITIVTSLRRVVGALAAALPGMGSIFLLLGLIFYVFSVMATKLFGASFPDWFGTIGASAYSLFQIMTLESWSMGIVRPVMEIYPYAWAFFVPFILCATFIALNLFIGVIVSALQGEHEQQLNEEQRELDEERKRLLGEAEAAREATHDDTVALGHEIRWLRRELHELRASLGIEARS
jgi:voltage-gated sodium channel